MRKILPPILLLITAILMVAADYCFPMREILAPDVGRWGFLLIVSGIAMAMIARLQFARANTNIYTFDEPGTLLTNGIFAVSRNPMYLGFSLTLLGGALWLGSLSALLLWAGFVVITDRWYIAFEERAMRQKFGDDFDHYVAKTRRWF
ncbi:MAG: isoprenylcysteine carboxylmethyltransferase family protein [Pseudomonadota bacterium]